MSFAELKKKAKDSVAKIQEKMKADRGGYEEDTRYWKLTVDKNENGYAKIRFLPPPEGEEYPYVILHHYSIKKNGKWFIENSRTTLGKNEPDPVSEYFFAVRGDGKDEVKKDAARPFARKTSYITNILVIDDPAKPENNGKVFLYKFGQTIFDKIINCISPASDRIEPFDPFDFWGGADFELSSRRNRQGFRSYDDARFDARAPLSGNDEELEELYGKLYSLKAEVAPNKFLSYADLKAKFEKFLNISSKYDNDEEDDEEFDRPKMEKKTPPTTHEAERRSFTPPWEDEKPSKKPADEEPPKKIDDEDDDLARYRALVMSGE